MGAVCAAIGVFGTQAVAHAATSGVSIKRFQFTPSSVTIKVGEAVRWMADIGGYTGPKSSGGPPGSVVIRRAFERILIVAMTMEGLDREGKLR